MGSITVEERTTVRSRSPIGGKYDTRVNRESAYELLNQRTVLENAPPAKAPHKEQPQQQTESSAIGDLIWGTKHRQGMVETMAKQAARTVGSQIGRQVLRGVLGGILGGSRRN
jgi:hypothetical protein